MRTLLNAFLQALLALLLLATGAHAAELSPRPASDTAPETATDFGQRMAATIAGHPEVVGARRSLDAAQLGIDAARAGYYPRVSVGSDIGRDNTVNANGTGTDAVSRRAVDVTLRQNVYTGGRLTAQVGIAQTEQSQLQIALRQANQRVALEALTAHLQVSRAASLLALAGASERATQGLLDLESRRAELGGGTRSDADFARTRLSLARERTRQYEVQLEEAANAYRQVFQEPPQIDAMADLTLLPQRLPADLQTAVDMALASHPDLRAAELVRERATGNLALEKAQRLPSVELVAMRVIDNAPEAQASGRTNSSIGLKLNYSLYSGGESKARIGAAAAQMEAQAEALITARRLVEANVRLYHRRMSGAVERTELLQSAANDAYNVFVNRKRLREFGRETAVAVLDAQLEYNNVLVSLVNATFDSRQNAIRLANALGILAEDSGVATWFSEFVDRARPLDQLRKRIEEAGRIDTAYRPPAKPTAPAVAEVAKPTAPAVAEVTKPTAPTIEPDTEAPRPRDEVKPPALEAAATPPAPVEAILATWPGLPPVTLAKSAPISRSSAAVVRLAVLPPAAEPVRIASASPAFAPSPPPRRLAAQRTTRPAVATASAGPVVVPPNPPWRVAQAPPAKAQKAQKPPMVRSAIARAAVVQTASVRSRHRQRVHRHAPPRPTSIAAVKAPRALPTAPSQMHAIPTTSVISALNPFGLRTGYQQQGVFSIGLVSDMVTARSRSRVLEARAHESPQ